MRAQKLITEHLDLWTSASTKKSTSGRGSNGKIELTGIKKLRELILELAIRGKLVVQNPTDEAATHLLSSTKALREQLAKEGKLRILKRAISADDIEKPFEIPTSWSWATLPDIASYSPGKTPSTKAPKYWATGMPGIPWVSIADLNHDGTVRDTTKEITKVAADEVFKSEPVSPGTILMSFKLTVGKVSLTEVPVYHNEAIISILPFKGVSRDYLFKIIPMLALGGNTKRAIMGNTLNATSLAQILVPLPPEKEQHRIVQKVDELMALCDRLEQQTSDQLEAHETLVDTLLRTLTQSENATELANNWARLSAHFDTLFTTEQSIDKLKQTILQLAVMGRLVEQDGGVEPVSTLLQSIETQKGELIKAGAMKRSKPLPPISQKDYPFRLPNGWGCHRLGRLVTKLGSGSTPRGGQRAYVDDGVPFLRSQNVWNEELRLEDIVYISEETHKRMSNTVVYPQDILLNITGASLGRSTIFPGHIPEANVSQHVTIIRLIEPAMTPFVHLCIQSPLIQSLVWDRQVGMAIEGLSKKVLEQFEMPIPPLEEQHRIVQKVDELMTLCDKLKDSINHAKQTQCLLADSVIKQSI